MSERYSRQILFSPIGRKGQEKLKKKHVLIIGAGALGSASGEMLTRSGIGKITIVDRDYVEESNLQRQQLYTEEDVRKKLPKAIAAEKRLIAINSEINIKGIVEDVTFERLEELIQDVDLIMDATDNFETRMVINDISQKYELPWIYGACVGSYGMSFTIIPNKTPCLSCILKSIPLQGMTCDTGGIISPAVQMVVAHQVAEALKILVEDFSAVREAFVSFDLWRNQYSSIKVSKIKDPTCLSCGIQKSYPYLQLENVTKSTILCGRDTVQIRPPKKKELHLETLSEQLKSLGYKVSGNPFLISIQKGNSQRMVIFKDGRALIHGTKDLAHAKSLYHQILG